MTTRFLDKVEEKFGLSVAISLAKQAIEQNKPLVQKLKNTRSDYSFCHIITNLLTWENTMEGYDFWKSIHSQLYKEYSISYSDLKEYAKKDINDNSLTLLEALEKAEGKSTTLAFCNNILANPIANNFNRDIKLREMKYTLKTATGDGFYWSETKEGRDFWGLLCDRSDDKILYRLSFSMIEDYVKNADIKPTITNSTITKIKIIKPIITKSIQKTLKETNMTMIAPFNKGNLNIKGIIHQSAKGIIDTRPFIKALIEEEQQRILNQIKDTPAEVLKYSGYNIKIHYYVNQILAIKTLLNNGSPVSISTSFMIDFYAFEKLLKKESTKPEDSYEWIASYLTQENMQKPEVTLFKSNKFHIFLRNGYIYLKDITKNVLYDTPVVYNKTSNTFHL